MDLRFMRCPVGGYSDFLACLVNSADTPNTIRRLD